MEKEIKIPINGLMLVGTLMFPNESSSLVIFSHGSGSSRFNPRSNYVARILNKEKLSRLMIDLLTQQENTIYANQKLAAKKYLIENIIKTTV